MSPTGFFLAIEGGGSHTQAALFDPGGTLLATVEAGDVNINFTTPKRAAGAITQAITEASRRAAVPLESIVLIAFALVSSRSLVEETLQQICPQAQLRAYTEADVVFARAGYYQPHGLAIVAGTGATVFAVRHDDGRRGTWGGWGSLLGDEGSAYAIGLQGLQAAARAWEGRESPTALIDAAREHFSLSSPDFKAALIDLAYCKPLSRAEIASFARAVSRQATEGDVIAQQIMERAAGDLTSLALHAARSLFNPDESFIAVVAGGLVQAGDLILEPLRRSIQAEYPRALVVVGTEEPAVSLGRLVYYHGV